MDSGINYVGVRVSIVNGISFGGGVLEVVKDYSPEESVCVRGEVVSLPLRIMGGVDGMDWYCDNALEVGDEVWFDYHEALMAMGSLADRYQEHEDSRYMFDGEDLILFIRYDFIYYGVRDGVKVMLNGYYFVEVLENSREVEGIMFKEEVNKKVRYCKVLDVGGDVSYVNESYSHPEVNVGDVLLVIKNSLRVVSNSLYVGGGVVVQSRFVLGRVVNG